MIKQTLKLKKDQTKLHSWYIESKRPFPWRKDRNPYKIWISEIMLQQTTTTAVIPFFQRFIKKLPNIKSLALAEESTVLELWAGLGYYSRAKNLHKAAQSIHQLKSFPKTYKELIKLSGFGPYTSRAVSSLAFGEKVGVLDGNVIRVLSRKHAFKAQWWKTNDRSKLQDISDTYSNGELPSHEMNQALMELGATICTSTSPKCILCPWLKTCEGHKENLITQLPLKKPKKAQELWTWSPYIFTKNNKIALVKNTYAPFLKGQWLLPGTAKLIQNKPKAFDFNHSITHHKIYIKINKAPLNKLKNNSEVKWVLKKDIPKVSPTSLIQKTLKHNT